jgi:hypothetical protein
VGSAPPNLRARKRSLMTPAPGRERRCRKNSRGIAIGLRSPGSWNLHIEVAAHGLALCANGLVLDGHSSRHAVSLGRPMVQSKSSRAPAVLYSLLQFLDFATARWHPVK